MLRRLGNPIVIAMVLGIAVGAICHNQMEPQDAARLAGYFSIVTDVFIRLIRMIIGPLVFSTLVVGIAHMGDASTLGRIGVRTFTWFIGASLVSLFLGLGLVNLIGPGENLGLALPEAVAAAAPQGSALNLRDFITHLVPRSFFEAMANNEILQIVVFSAFVGIAAMNQGHHGKVVADLANSVANIMLEITSYVMKAAPFAIFAALSSVVTTQGLDILAAYGRFMGGFYFALLVLWAILIGAGFLLVGPSIGRLISALKEPILLAFSAASSEAAYPKTLDQLEKFGVSKRVACFVLPVGYSFNLDGSMMYCTFAVMFIAQAYNIEVSFGHQITMLLLLMITSKGMAGVPRASLVVIAATLTTFNLPEAGLLLILGVDQFLDMGRSATNVVGNAIATTAVARWENELHPTTLAVKEQVQPT